MHPNLQVALDRLVHLLLPDNGISIIIVSGVSGVGKSAMLKSILPALLAQKSYARSDGVLYVSAPAEIEKTIMPKAFYSMVLQEGGDPLIEGKMKLSIIDGRLKAEFGRKSPTAAVLSTTMKGMFRFRDFHVLVIDELIHLLQHGSDEIMLRMIKDVSKEDCPKLVIVSDLLSSRQARASDQYVRRGRTVMFERYVVQRNDSAARRRVIKQGFNGILQRYEAIWPWKERPNLQSRAEELRLQSLGEIGVLKSVLVGALAMQNRNDGKWLWRYVEDNYLPEYQRADLEVQWMQAEEEWRKYAFGVCKDANRILL